jgi:transposase
LVAQHRPRLRQVTPEDLSSVIRLVSDHRDDLVIEHTSAINRLHRLLRDLVPGGAPTQLSSRQAGILLRRLRRGTATDTTRKQLARDLLNGLQSLEARIKSLTDQISALVGQSGSTLTEIPGVGSIVAAKIIGHTGDVARFPDNHHFASFNGTAPIDASSGDQTRHRLSRRGDRQLNAAIHVIAIYQISHPGPGRDYYLKKDHAVENAQRSSPSAQTTALRHRLPPPHQRPPHLTISRRLTQRRYQVTPAGPSHQPPAKRTNANPGGGGKHAVSQTTDAKDPTTASAAPPP